jgi:hypothetical protein
VDHFIPYAMQKGLYDKNWHDASQDLGQDHRIRLNVSSFMKMLNDKRRTLQIPPLKYNDKLEVSYIKLVTVYLLVAVFWELYEYIHDLMIVREWNGWFDTTSDIINGGIGMSVLYLFVRKK